MRFSVTFAFLFASAPALSQSATPSIADLHADPIAAIQGEWVTRFCSKDFRWLVEGRTVKMYKHDAKQGPTAYDNRYAEGAVIRELTEEYDRSDRGIRFKTTSVQPDGYRSAPGKGDIIAVTLYWNDPDTKKSPYLSLGEMLRTADKAKQCS